MAPKQLLMCIVGFLTLFALLPAKQETTEQFSVCHCIKEDDTPTMQQLMKLDVPEKPVVIPIMEKIGSFFSKFGTFLLNDKDGSIMRTIEHDHKRTEDVLHEIFNRWFTTHKASSGEKSSTCTWEVLVTVLRQAELNALADDIEKVLQFCAERYLNEECTSRCVMPVHGTNIDSSSSQMTITTLMVVTFTSVIVPAVVGVAAFYYFKRPENYTSYLKKLYETMKQHGSADDGSWPPPVTKDVFRLAMIMDEEVYRYKMNDDFVKHTITGKVDDILQKKVPIELKQVVDNCLEKIILLEGAPGCGKSTLSLHICDQWAKGELCQQFSQVILVKLREPKVQRATKLSDILPKENETKGCEIDKYLTNCKGKGVLFLLDGWDELQPNATGRLIINDILKRNRLPDCSVIITSRPTSSMSLHDVVDTRIEILGFTQNELKQFFARCLEKNAEKFLEKIQENPAVAGSCYLPLNASILVHVFKVTKELPKTQFGIFTSLIRNCICRHQKKTKQPIEAVKSLDNLPSEIKGQFSEICSLAYEAIIEDKIILEDLGHDFNTLGLLQSQQCLTDGGESYSHNFLHLSLQELCAALYMATQLKPEEQVAKFRQLFGRARFSAVFMYYAAYTKLQIVGMKQLLIEIVEKVLTNPQLSELTPNPDSSDDDPSSSDLSFGHKRQPLIVSLLKCVFEAQDKQLSEQVVKEFTDSKLSLSGISLNPTDCLALGWFLTHCKQFEVDLSDCSIGDDECKTLFRPDQEYESLNLWKNSIGDEGAMAISEAMKTMTNLQYLSLGCNSIGDKGAIVLSEAMKTMTNLQELSLSENSIRDVGAMALSEAMKTMTNLKLLYLFNNSIGNVGVMAISEAIKTMTNLKELHVGDNSIGDEGAMALSEALKAITNLQWLTLENNSIGDTGAMAISEAMKTMTNLQELVLMNNSIGDKGAMVISESIKSMTSLRYLDLGGNSIGDEGAMALSEAMKTNLLELKLRYNAAISEVVKEAVKEAAKLSGTKISI